MGSFTDLAVSPDGIRIAYETRGSGSPALVFVHGWSCDRTYWRGQIDHFASRRRVVAIDLAGHGSSEAGRSSWTMPAFGEDVVAVVDRLGLDKMVLIGHSMGGDVIVEAGLRLGGRVTGLVWVDVYSDLDQPRDAREIERFVAPFREDFVSVTRAFVRGMFVPGSDPALIDRVVEDMASAAAEVAVDALRHAVSNDASMPGLLRRLASPIVAMNPDNRPTNVEGLRRLGVRTVLMPGVGHFPMLEDPERFNRLLSEVIEGFER